MRRTLLTLTASAALFGCSSSSSTGSVSGPSLQLDRSGLLFGQDTGDAVLLGTAPAESLQLTNNGTADVVISAVTIVAGTLPDGGKLDHPELFTKTGPVGTTIKPNATDFVQVIFKPLAAGLVGATLQITSNAPNSPQTVVLSGDCVTPLISLNGAPTTLTLPNVALRAKTGGGFVTGYSEGSITLFNTGTADLSFPADPLPSFSSGPFTVTSITPTHVPRAYPDGGIARRPLPDGGTEPIGAELTVRMSTAIPGDYTQPFTVTSDATNTPSLALTVHGTATPDGG
jgi:hypothetical protein